MKLDVREFEKSLRRTYSVGIFDQDSRFKNSDYKVAPKSKYYGQGKNKENALVNKKATGYYGKKTTQQALETILNSDKYKIPKVFLEDSFIFEVVAMEVIERGLDEDSDKRVNNFLKGSLQKHYLKSMSRYKNKPRRIKQKGFDRYGVGTGQLLDEITSERIK